jgi:hypothetical protein
MSGWETVAAVTAIVAPLVGVPLTVILFYLRGTREQQAARFADLTRRADVLEASARRLAEDHAAMQRDYATKEEWLRESMWSRGRIEHLGALAARMEMALERVSESRAAGEGFAAAAGEGDSGEESR